MSVDSRERMKWGVRCSVLGILLNLIMVAGKLLAGKLTGSIAMVADALNNLSDAGSSVVTLFGFHEARRAADEDHPFGHGRMEYVSGLIVSLLILLMGVELLKESIGKLLDPEPTTRSTLAIVILVASIFIKLFMAWYNRRIGKRIDSPAMQAVAVDSLSDVGATTMVLLATILNPYVSWNLDAIGGILVSLLILWAGISSTRDTVSPLLGKKPSPELVKQVEEIVRKQKDILNTHDMMIHDYGPGRLYVSLHAEVPGNGDIYALHDEIDNAEKELKETLHCEAVIHMDPISVDDAKVRSRYDAVKALIKENHPGYTIHDFRMVSGSTHTNLIFDCVVPTEEQDLKEIEATLKSEVEKSFPDCYAVITVEHSYV